jgi:hypothetical protein
MTSEARHLGITIARAASEVYAYAREPENLVHWASGLGAVRRVRGGWVADMAGEQLRLRFTPRNRHGVLDHWVTPPGGTEIHIPLRVIDNDDGCELLLTLFRQPGMTDAQFAADADWVMRDLTRLKQLLEAAS